MSLIVSHRRRKEKQELRVQIEEYRDELAKISQVDEFAKYSKVQRKLRLCTDQLNAIARQNLEKNFEYIIVGQALAWLFTSAFIIKLIYQLYYITMEQFGYF